MTNVIDTTVRKSVTVHASLEHAFKVFTEGFDTWWPRSHSIGKAPMQATLIEPRQGGRCFERSIDGTECMWGTVLVWDPPRRLVLAWQINSEWQYEPDLTLASEVEVLFTRESDRIVRVDLEHRHLERHGAGADKIRTAIDGPGGWSGLLQLFAQTAEKENA